ncbi:MAG: SUMF1/EgtB/PvdO family nonheme iron enzyme [Bacteroidetes bacterium]|nr:SUMF1/EgtB/PvdO family nonheme iron enzyme [Bacteroidota bacterium]
MKLTILLSALSVIPAWSKPKPHKVLQDQPPGFVYVPAGALYQLSDKKRNMAAFWMKECEVSNAEYRAYIQDLTDSGKTEEARLAWPDTLLQKSVLWIGKVSNYFTHPFFHNYPVTGITRPQAEKYCEWLTKRYNREHGDFPESNFRLPNPDEWEYAARGGRTGNSYPWGSTVRNSKGCPLAVWNDGEAYQQENSNTASMILYYQWLYHDVMQEPDLLLQEAKKKRRHRRIFWGLPQQVDTYFPNDWGLYHPCGNVAEMMADGQYMGGSFRTLPGYMNLNWHLPHPFPGPGPQADVGFRPVMSYIPPRIKDK